MQADELKSIARQALEELKGVNIVEFDVRDMTSVTDFMVIASGTSDRHVKSLADAVVVASKQAGVKPLGVEGEREGEWVLVDLGDVVVHVMLPATRDFYDLERLWRDMRLHVEPFFAFTIGDEYSRSLIVGGELRFAQEGVPVIVRQAAPVPVGARIFAAMVEETDIVIRLFR